MADNKQTTSTAASSVAKAIATAGYGMFLTALPLSSTSKGCFLSPLSVTYALSLAVNGARPGSPTQVELLRAIATAGSAQHPAEHQQQPSEEDVNSELGRAMALMNSPGGKGDDAQDSSAAGGDGGPSGSGGDVGPSSELILANSVWTTPGFQLKPAYVEQMDSLFQATARVASNGAKDVNEWVTEVTRGMIKVLVQSDNFTSILANAIYFKGFWAHAFKKELTQPGLFTTAGGASKQVDMMQQEFEARDRIQGVHKEGLYDAVVLPYRGGSYSAVALLPAPGVAVERALREWAGQGLQEVAPLGRVVVKLPKFKVSTSLTLAPVLKALGVQAAFSPGAADFGRMAEPGLFISDVVHKAVVEVDEEGTVAAAATAVIMCLCVPAPPRELVFDRPFAFIIQHNPTGLPAFIGVVNDPSAA